MVGTFWEVRGWCYIIIAAKAVACISVLTMKWLSCQRVPLVDAANQQKKKIRNQKPSVLLFRINLVRPRAS